MKRVLASLLVGGLLGGVPGVFALQAQAPELLEDNVEGIEWEPIPEEDIPRSYEELVQEEDTAPSMSYEGPTWDQIRTREAVTAWWLLDHGDDPEIPDDIEEAAVAKGFMFQVCPEWLLQTCYIETGGTWRCDIKDATGSCVGPMQINIVAQRERIAAYGLTPDDMYDPDAAMLIAASYTAELFERYEDPAVVAYKYNGNTTGLQNYRETGVVSGYAKRLTEGAAQMERRHGK